MLVSINATTITSEEVRITATNLETILLADDLYSQINDKEEEEEPWRNDRSTERLHLINFGRISGTLIHFHR